MPPKKSSTASKANGTTAGKRKSPASETNASKPAKKAPRQGSRVSSRSTTSNSNSNKTTPAPSQILHFLLSPASLPLCFPSDELSSASTTTTTKSYSRTSPTHLSLWEHLLIASLLSKPLSHTLGMRSARTLLNSPYSFTTASATASAGEHCIWEALEAARTQHRQKTASYVHGMAEVMSDESKVGDLEGAARDGGARGVQAWIKTNIKGMGVTGGEIFCRRVQCLEGSVGEAVWPYADPRGIEAVRALGLEVKSADELQGLIERVVDWDRVGEDGNGFGLDAGPEGGKAVEMEQQVAVEFVVVLERAIGAGLEGNVEEVRRKAAEM